MSDLGLRRAVVVYTGEEERSMGGGIQLVPWSSVAAGDFDLPL
jgi:hypothetical protein